MSKSVFRPVTGRDSSDSSESSSDDDSTAAISLELYTAADIAGGLSRRRDFVRATRELTAILRRRVHTCVLAPAVQAALLEDCHRAVELCNRTSLQRGVVNDLVRAAAAAFPRVKGNRLTRAWKARSVDLARIAKKASLPSPDVAECSSAVSLPAEVFEAILSQLQPVSLGNAAAVCRDWRAAVANDALWRHFLPVHTRDDTQTYRQQFLARVADGSPNFQMYTSRRVCIGSELRWMDPEDICSEHNSCFYPLVDEVVCWIFRQTPGPADESSTDSD